MKFIKNIIPRFALVVMLFTVITGAFAQNQSSTQRTNNTQNGYIDGEYKPYEVLDTRIDNMSYWRKVAELGLAPVAPKVDVLLGIPKSSRINALKVVRDDSPDVPVTDESSTQSENSIIVDPNNPDHVLQSNNSTTNPTSTLFGANAFFSLDFGQTWDGQIQDAGGQNSGDPATGIGLSGRQYVGYISATGGMGVSYSDNGTTWTQKTASNSASLDKNHLTIDNSTASPYEGNVYNAWVAFAGNNNNEIEFVRSINDGESYSSPINISSAVNAGGHNQGVNLQTGPNGEVYAVWAIYDSWPQDEKAIGFARSYNGGMTFQPATRAIDDIKGIRNTSFPKNQRVNSFPAMAVDRSDGPWSGNIYVVWTNKGVPGINSSNDRDIYLIKSEDEGETWSDPIRVNQDVMGEGHTHYFPWITCDPSNGVLSVIFYDDRNVGGNKCEVFCANSIDGGETWEDFRVSDTDFTPSPIPGLAGDYMGDYLGISAHSGKVYPVWCDNRDGVVMTYTSPYELNPLQASMDLTADLVFETGEVTLNWQFEAIAGFQYFKIYRNDFEIGTTTDLTYTDNLPNYGVYTYLVTAIHDDGESFGPEAIVQWGDGHVAVDPEEIVENILPNTISSRFIIVENVGELDLVYEISASTEPLDGGGKDYCIPTAICTQGDGIFDFAMADIDNVDNGCSPDGYELLLEDLLLEESGIHTAEITIPLGVPTGGAGIYTYDWTSNPAGFTSTDPDPIVNPEENTSYFVEVNDGENSISGQTSVVVNQLPETPDMPMGEESLCWGEYQTVYSTDGSTGSATYQWTLEPMAAGTIASNGMTATVTWDEDFTGIADIMVGGINDCGDGEMSDALMVSMNELPTVDLGEDFSICANEVVILDAGNPGASYMWSTGETTQTIEVDSTGTGIGSVEIWVEVIDAETCTNNDTIMITFDDCTGTTELSEAWSINVSPNPSNGRFVIEIKTKTDSPVDLEIFNMHGTVVYREANVYTNQSMDKTVDLQSYPEGIYFLNIKGDGINMIKKIVLQR